MIFLKKDPENVVVVNCRAGKGRTGTIISCFLLYCSSFNTPKAAMQYYSKQRFNFASGVTQPSQVRYIYYFYESLSRMVQFPIVRRLVGVFISKLPIGVSADSFQPYVEIYLGNGDNLSFSTKNTHSAQKKVYSNNSKTPIEITDSFFDFIVTGDVTIKLFSKGMWSKSKLGRVAFNTNFTKANQKFIVFKTHEIDPDNFADSEIIPAEFEIHVVE